MTQVYSRKVTHPTRWRGDDNALPISCLRAKASNLAWATLSGHKWVTSGERRGGDFYRPAVRQVVPHPGGAGRCVRVVVSMPGAWTVSALGRRAAKGFSRIPAPELVVQTGRCCVA